MVSPPFGERSLFPRGSNKQIGGIYNRESRESDLVIARFCLAPGEIELMKQVLWSAIAFGFVLSMWLFPSQGAIADGVNFDLSKYEVKVNPANGHRYLLTESNTTWTAAREEAESLGGYLVTIDDRKEEQWLLENFSGAPTYYIGVTDARAEGEYQWVNGESLANTYANWLPGEPNDYKPFGGEDYGEILPQRRAWNDVPDNYRQTQGIVELPQSPTFASATVE